MSKPNPGGPVPVYTTGGIGKPSEKVDPKPGTTFVSAYTGEKLSGHPTFSTRTDDPTGKNPTYHGGIQVGSKTVVCHYQEGATEKPDASKR